MTHEEKIRTQYLEHEKAFDKIKEEVLLSLQNVNKAFYQKTRFKAIIPGPRIKTIDSVLAKMKKKEIVSDSLFTKEADKLSLVLNDFVGTRILCNTSEDVEEIEKILLQNRRFSLIKKEKLAKPNGYRAVHLDVLYEVHWDDNLIYVPIEIQIKTHLQNAWSEVTHDESYKPENEEYKNEWEKEYSKHMADILDTLDRMASTIRMQRLAFVKPPASFTIRDSDTLINTQTLSYKIDSIRRSERLTQQEMSLSIGRLKGEGFETLAEVVELISDTKIEKQIKEFKESLRNNENVGAFEILYYGSLLKRGKQKKFEEEMSRDYGFVQIPCLDCNRLLTSEEFEFINEKTDSDIDYYCADHRDDHFPNECTKCGIRTSATLCKNCEAQLASL